MNKKSLTSIRKDILKLLIEIGENLNDKALESLLKNKGFHINFFLTKDTKNKTYWTKFFTSEMSKETYKSGMKFLDDYDKQQKVKLNETK